MKIKFLDGTEKEFGTLQSADLQGANLRSANLQGANLYGACLYGAYLRDANLQGANLQGANLQGANLQGANLQGANLRNADLRSADLPRFQIPQDGAITGWKKLKGGVLAQVRVPAQTPRTISLFGRKCRAHQVRVLQMVGGDSAVSMHDGKTVYTVGALVKADKYDGDIRVECTHGIHFYLTRQEAEEH